MFLTDGWQSYEVLDTGDGQKLERWGDVILVRPDPQVIWPPRNPALWAGAHATYLRSAQGGGEWVFAKKLPESWEIPYNDLAFSVRPTGFKHTGLFPEQASNWDWMRSQLASVSSGKVLNLFAYTGAATLACAAAGAQVTHVDASKGITQWARNNYEHSRLPFENARWIVEDCLAFVQREIRRGNRYDGILMDPPSYGRGPNGEVWKLEDSVYGLMREAAQLLSDAPRFFLVSSYTTGLQPAVLSNLLELCCPVGRVIADELCLPVTAGGVLPCGSSGRWTP